MNTGAFNKEYTCFSDIVELLPKIGTQSILLEIKKKWRGNKYNRENKYNNNQPLGGKYEQSTKGKGR